MPGSRLFGTVKSFELLEYIIEKSKNDHHESLAFKKMEELINIMIATVLSAILSAPISVSVINAAEGYKKKSLYIIIAIVLYIIIWFFIKHVLLKHFIPYYMNKKMINDKHNGIDNELIVKHYNCNLINSTMIISALIRNYRSYEISKCVKKIYLTEIIEDWSRIIFYIEDYIVGKEVVSNNRNIKEQDKYISKYSFDALVGELNCIYKFLSEEITKEDDQIYKDYCIISESLLKIQTWNSINENKVMQLI